MQNRRVRKQGRSDVAAQSVRQSIGLNLPKLTQGAKVMNKLATFRRKIGFREPIYQGLMRCYEKLDRRTEAIGAYRRLRQTLSLTLGLHPSASTEKLYQSLRAG